MYTDKVWDISTCTDIFSRLLGKYCSYSNKILRMFINSNGKPSVFRIFKKYSTDQKLAYLSLYVILSRLSAWVILSALS